MRKTFLIVLVALSFMCFIACSSGEVLAPFNERFESIYENATKQEDGLYIWAYNNDDIKYIIIFVDDVYHTKQSFSDDSWKDTEANFKALEDAYGNP